MKRWLLIFAVIFMVSLFNHDVAAQCAMCTKTAQQLGQKPAEGMNAGILYLMLTPFAIVGFIAFRWWKNNKASKQQ